MSDRLGEISGICPKCGAVLSNCDNIRSDRAEGTSSDPNGEASGNPSAGLFSNGFIEPDCYPESLGADKLALRLRNSGVVGTLDELEFLVGKLNYRTIRKYSRAIEKRAGANALTASNIQVFAYFDRALQATLLQGIGVVELQFRAAFASLMAEQLGPFAHHYEDNFKNREHYQKFVNDYGRELEYKVNSKSAISIDDFNTYHDVPIWQAVEILGLGTLSKLYRNTKDRTVRKGVADSFGVKYEYLTSWLRTICEIRNRCAHFEDVCVTPIACKPKRIEWLKANNSSIFYAVAVINRLIEGGVKEIRNDVQFMQAQKFLYSVELLTNDVPQDVFLAAGFPINWAKQLAVISLHQTTLYKRYTVGGVTTYQTIYKKE